MRPVPADDGTPLLSIGSARYIVEPFGKQYPARVCAKPKREASSADADGGPGVEDGDVEEQEEEDATVLGKTTKSGKRRTKKVRLSRKLKTTVLKSKGKGKGKMEQDDVMIEYDDDENGSDEYQDW